MKSNSEKLTSDRQARHTSHALVEIKLNRWWPFGIKSGVLLDISVEGFKVEFTSEVKIKSLQKLWISIPLAPLGMMGPKFLSLPVEVRWFDESKYRIGGIFLELDKTDLQTVRRLVGVLAEKGLNKP